jgi:hypothetical protein
MMDSRLETSARLLPQPDQVKNKRHKSRWPYVSLKAAEVRHWFVLEKVYCFVCQLPVSDP